MHTHTGPSISQQHTSLKMKQSVNLFAAVFRLLCGARRSASGAPSQMASCYCKMYIAAAKLVADTVELRCTTRSEARREIVRRMEALMAMPRATRKHASHVGGLEPSINETGWSDMPKAYDAGNTVYAAAYDLILDDVGIKEVHYLREYNNETKGDVIEALLGAAMVTATEKLGQDIVYSDLVGGTTPRGDMATRVLIETIDDTIAWLDESFERDPWISSRWTPFAVV